MDKPEAVLPSGVVPSPSSPQLGLPVAPVEASWRPPALIAGDLDGLRRAIEGRRVMVQAPSLAASTPGRDTALAVVETLGAIPVGVDGRSLDAAVRAGSFTLERVAPTAGGPRYRFAESMLVADWNAEASTPGTELVVFVDDAPIDAEAWRALEAYAVGSCDPTLEALAIGQEQSLAYLEGFLDHADALLQHHYRLEATRTLPELVDRLSRFALVQPVAGADLKTHECGRAMHEAVSAATCSATDECAAAPRMILRGDASVVAPVLADLPASDCAQRVGHDGLAEVREVRRAATEAATAQLDPRWSELAARAATVTSVHDALSDACTPRRRRISDADIAEIRRRQDEVHAILGEDPRSGSVGQWLPARRRQALTESEQVDVLATYHGGSGSAAIRAAGAADALREFVFDRSQCVAPPGELPLAVVVADPTTDRVTHVGFYFPEELWCAQLGPRASESADGAG